MHQMIHTNERRKKCKICGLELRSNSHMSRHMRVHTGEKVCCTFFLTMHLKLIHPLDLVFNEFDSTKQTNCFFSFFYSFFSRSAVVYADKNLLKGKLMPLSHYYPMNFTYEISYFHCLCSRYNMKTHFNAHQGIHRVQTKNHKCILCDQAFARRERLSKHLMQEHGVSKEDSNKFVEKGPSSEIAEKILKNARESLDSLEDKEDILVEYIDEDGEFVSNESIALKNDS